MSVTISNAINVHHSAKKKGLISRFHAVKPYYKAFLSRSGTENTRGQSGRYSVRSSEIPLGAELGLRKKRRPAQRKPVVTHRNPNTVVTVTRPVSLL